MKNVAVAILGIASLLLAGCKNKEQSMQLKDYPAEQVINVDLDDVDKQVVSFLEQIEDISIIPLEYNDSFLLSYALPQTIVAEDAIYMLDDHNDKVYGFDDRGKLQFVINSKGRGPNEYMDLTCLSISNKGELALYDATLQKMFYYDQNGKIVHIDNIDTKANEIVCLDGGFFALLTRTLTMISDDKNCIKITNEKGEIVRSFLELPSWVQNSTLQITPGSFSFYGTEPLLTLPWCYKIFSIGIDAVKCKYLLDFGEYNISDTYLEEHEDWLDDNMAEVVKDKVVFSVNFFQECDNHVFFQSVMAKNIYYTLFDKSTKVASTVSSSSEELPAEWGFVIDQFLASKDNTLYCLCELRYMEGLLVLCNEGKVRDDRLTALKDQYLECRDSYIGAHADHVVMLAFKMK